MVLKGESALDEPVLPFDEVERRVFEHALRRCDGNVTRAAKALGGAKGTFYSKIRRYGLAPPEASQHMGPGEFDSLPFRKGHDPIA